MEEIKEYLSSDPRVVSDFISSYANIFRVSRINFSAQFKFDLDQSIVGKYCKVITDAYMKIEKAKSEAPNVHTNYGWARFRRNSKSSMRVFLLPNLFELSGAKFIRKDASDSFSASYACPVPYFISIDNKIEYRNW
jgi:hypothetical protein